MEGKEIVDRIIEGRAEPHIYAFSTKKAKELEDYLKIGDTYRPVHIRLKEWEKHYKPLEEKYREKAMVNKDVLFRDYDVHSYLKDELKKEHLEQEDLPKDIYYSNEFYKNVTKKDLKKAIQDIKDNYNKNGSKYHYYEAKTYLPKPPKHFERSDKEWKIRDNQKEVIEKFKEARDNGRKNLLMYAVMRFGKSFTSIMCAKEMDAKFVVIVSAKKDVEIEWQENVEIPKNFKEFSFVKNEELMNDYEIINKKISNGEKVVAFLTLQDLKDEYIKEKHKNIFENTIDLLIVDETHFAARAEKYGRILKDSNNAKYIKEKRQNEKYTIDEINKKIEQLTSKKIFDVDTIIHLSGTPYRILMGSEFKEEDIIAFCQFSNIVEDQKNWDEQYFDKIAKGEKNPDTEDSYQEWDNPYYGFPEMIRFAFNPSKKAKEKLEEYKKRGHTYAFSALLKPKSIEKKDDGSHKKFENEKEVLELFEVIDGSRADENVFGFLDYEKIKEGKMCRHIVCVLPYKASCDALENLLKKQKNKFKNLREYEIINIGGVDIPRKYNCANFVDIVKNEIRECEEKDLKTITLTVNKMLTGVTVKEWDTMIYLKDTSSPQEYDQAIFRLQSQYVKEYYDKTEERKIKENMKPQTLLVDFDPYRMFLLQAQKSLIYDTNIGETGNMFLRKRLEEEIKISPIITINQDKIIQVTVDNIIEKISEYSRNKGVLEETLEIPVDLNLLNFEEIKKEILIQAEIGSKDSLFIDNTKEDGTDMDLPDEDGNEKEMLKKENNENQKDYGKGKSDPVKQFRTYYARILFYSFLSNARLESMDEIINEIKNNEDNKILAKNLGLKLKVLIDIRNYMNWNILNQLDLKIRNINELSRDSNPLRCAKTAIKKFNKLSESEIITPDFICEDMINLIKDEDFYKIIEFKGKFLDLASKMAEFPLAIYEKALLKGLDVRNSIYSIPTSTIAYEFTKKIYLILGLNIDNIAKLFTSYDLLNIKNQDNIDYNTIVRYIIQNKKFSEIELEETPFFKKGEDKMKFDVVVGNPPYQLKGGSGGNNDALIFQHFANIASEINPEYTSLIIPSRWFSGGRDNLVADFRSNMLNNRSIEKMIVYTDASKIFDNVEIKGGVCYYLINNNYNGECNYTLHNEDNIESTNRNLNELDVLIREPKISLIVKKVLQSNINGETIDKIISNDTPFGIGSNPISGKKYSIKVYKDATKDHNTELYYIEKQKRKTIFVSRNDINKNAQDIDTYKILLPASAGSGNDPYILGKPEFANKNSVCSQSYLYSAFKTEQEARNFEKYLKTKFFRILVKALKITQGAPSKAYRFVPIQNFTKYSDIDWSKSCREIDLKLYKKYNLTYDETSYIESVIKKIE